MGDRQELERPFLWALTTHFCSRILIFLMFLFTVYVYDEIGCLTMIKQTVRTNILPSVFEKPAILSDN